MSQRFLSFPATLFEGVFKNLLPSLRTAWHQRKQRPPIEYFAAPENRDNGIVKAQRKPNIKLIVAPFPDRQRGQSQFFFETSSGTPLTTAIQA